MEDFRPTTKHLYYNSIYYTIIIEYPFRGYSYYTIINYNIL